MPEIRRRLAAIAYYSLASRIHTLVPGGYLLRRKLASMICGVVSPTARIAPGVSLSRHLTVEHGAGIGVGTTFLGGGEVVLGERLKMGPQCLFITNDHPIPPDGATFSDMPGRAKPIHVGRDVFIGARVTVLPGVTIGDGVAIGAGAVVARDLPPGAVAAGNPARVLRQRQV